MRLTRILKDYAWTLGLLPTIATLLAPPVMAMDTDIFTAGTNATAPNVLIVLDNTASYDNNKQHFPDGAQGQAEVDAIKQVISNLSGMVNVGFMEFARGASGGGYIRQAIVPMGKDQSSGPTNQATFSSTLTSIYNNFRSSSEKVPSNLQIYDNLMREAYNYYAGTTPYTPSSAVDSTQADSNGYTTNYSQFKSPLSSTNICAHNYIIFLGNPEPHGPNAAGGAGSDNTTALAAAGGDTTQLPLPVYTQGTQDISTDLTYTDLCYSSTPSFDQTLCSTSYDSCAYTRPDGTTDTKTTPMNACPTGKVRYGVVATLTNVSSTQSVANKDYYASSSTCYATLATAQAAVAGGDHAGMTCDADTVTYNGNVKTTVAHSCAYTIDSVDSYCSGTVQATTSPTTSCYASSSVVSSSDHGSLTCPDGYSCTYATGSAASACTPGANVVSTAQTSSCYASSASVGSSDHGTLTCPSGYTCTYSKGTTGTLCTANIATSAQTSSCYASSSAASSSSDHGTLTCPAGYSCSYSTGTTPTTCGSATTSTAQTSSCYASSSAASSSSDHGTLTCPAGYNCSYSTGTTPTTCGSVSTSTAQTSSCYASSSSVSSSDHGTLTCPSGYSCSYSTGATPSYCGGASVQTTSASSSSCYSSSSAINTSSDHGSLSCPSGYTCSYSVGSAASSCTGTTSTGTTGYLSSAPAATAADAGAKAGLSCPSGATCTYSVAVNTTATGGGSTSANTTTCYTLIGGESVGTGSGQWNINTTSDFAGLTCPSNNTCSYSGVTQNSSLGCGNGVRKAAVTQTATPMKTYTVTQTVAKATYTITQTATPSATFTVTQTATPTTATYAVTQTATPTTYGTYIVTQTATPSTASTYTVTQTATPVPTSQYTITQTATPTGAAKYKIRKRDTVTTTVETTTTSTSTLGNTNACYTSLASCLTSDYVCPSGATCACSDTGSTTTGSCPSGAYAAQTNMSIYKGFGWNQTIATTPTGQTASDTHIWNADEWARMLYQKGAPVNGSTTTRAPVSTYTIDVYKDKPDADQSSLLASMAKNGGGRYFNATNESAIINALKTIFSEIQAVNSAFASAALPIAANARGQNDNQVYIGMFRPDQQSFPRWFGNVKRYQLGVVSGGNVDLVDVNGSQAISPATGFITPCAQSYWTNDAGKYWATVSGSTVTPRVYFTTSSVAGTAWTTQGDDTLLAKGGCSAIAGSEYSDLPDGPVVEKGGVAEMIRSAVSRNVKTSLSGTTVVDFNSTNVTTASTDTTVNANIVNFIRGLDITGEINVTPSTTFRPSIHGDVVHSRPLPVDYGGTTGVRIYYGSNDGTYRSVNATTGAELWAYVASESFPYLQRLMDNTPVVQMPNPTPPGKTAAPGTAKDFFFDGNTGLYQNKDNTKVWIFPTMRRGGRMLYAFDVTNASATSPTLKWKLGCPHLSNDTGCSTNNLTNSPLTGIGQTWSTPNVAFLPGYSTTAPVVVLGAGYDTCEDADSVTTGTTFCSSPKGAGVYIVDADTGALIATFSTDRSVVSEVALVDVNGDGKVDLGYVADTGGNIYRIKFSDTSSFTPLAASQWTITKVAYTTGGSRKFLFAPALLPLQGKVYVALGSGDREHPTAASYPYTTPVTNRFYVYLDDPTSSTATNLDLMLDRSDASSDTCSTAPVLPAGTDKGWFMNLTAYGTGEQTVTSAIIQGGMVAFSTNRPIVSNASCSNDLGEARGYWVNLLNGSGAVGVSGTCGGSRSSTFVGGGLPPSPVTGVVTINGAPQNIVIGAVQRDGSPSTPIGAQKNNPPINSKRSRVYWDVSNDSR